MIALSGLVPCRNVISLDYPLVPVIESLLAVCDEVVACDSDSSDGTREMLDEWAARDSRVRVINYNWPTLATFETVGKGLPGPPGQPRMLLKWLEFGRKHLRGGMCLCTDADEVLDPRSVPAVREAVDKMESRWMRRNHYWKDAQHMTQDDKVVGTFVARLGPSALECVSDEPRPEGEPPIRRFATHDSRLLWHHYGFIRKNEAFFAKSKVMQPALCSSIDKRILDAEAKGLPWHAFTDVGELVEYRGEHPPCMRDWLTERGYDWRGKQ